MLLKQAYDNLVSENNNVVSVNKEPNDSDSSDLFHYQKTGPRKRKLLENVDFKAKKIKLEPVDFESETHEYVECEESKDVKVKLEPKFEPVKDEYRSEEHTSELQSPS